MKRKPPDIESLAMTIRDLAGRVAALEQTRRRPAVAAYNRLRATEREKLIKTAIGASPLFHRGLAQIVARRIERNPSRYGFNEKQLPTPRTIRAVIVKLQNETVSPSMGTHHVPQNSVSVTSTAFST